MRTMISIVDLHKSFGGNHVLNGVDLDIHEGELMAIIGESGCGKSVLLKHINGLLRPDRGAVRMRGRDHAQRSQEEMKSLRRSMGMVFQNSALFDSITVAQNMAMAARWNGDLSASQLKEIESILIRVGLKGILHAYPASLSGGMQKRVAIARALMMKPQILLYDEPTTGLDPPRAWSIMNLIEHLSREDDVTSVVVTHDLSRIQLFDKVVMLYKGRVHFDGDPDAFLASTDPTVSDYLCSTPQFIPVEEA